MGLEAKLLIAALAACAVLIALAVAVLVKLSQFKTKEIFNELRRDIADEMRKSREEINSSTKGTLGLVANTLINSQRESFNLQNERINALSDAVNKNLDNANVNLERIRRDNNEKLDKMRETVDEKLQKTLEEKLGQSFRRVNDQLAEVYKGLGEMRTLATGVGDLKKVLSNVKTRGVMGEVQLAAILEQVLAPEQYERNVATRPKATQRVEFAVKMPADDGAFIYLPIDAKFPTDAYVALVDAYETTDPAIIKTAQNAFRAFIKKSAKDISEKYIEPPYTTDFGIMFLPIEGIYAEVLRLDVLEELQRDYHITVAGPTTMAALLNSLQMGFRTLAIQQRSNEVWKLLCSVQVEFGKFGDTLAKTQRKLTDASDELENLVGTRTRQIQRRLKEVTSIPGQDAPLAGFIADDE